MARRQPTFYLLDRRNDRRTGRTERIAVDAVNGLTLAAEPGGPLGLGSADGSLGGLRLPRGVAIDGSGLVYLLVGHRLRRFEPASRRFVTVAGLGGRGREPRRFERPRDIAIAGPNLYIADRGNARVQVFDLRSLALIHLWRAPAAGSWRPWSVAAVRESAFILDREHGRVFRHRAGTDRLERVVSDGTRAGRHGGVAVDREEALYLLDTGPQPPVLRIFDRHGAPVGEVADAGQVGSRFDPVAIRLDHKGRFCLAESLAHLCDRRSESPPPADDPLAACRGLAATGLLFDRRGRPARLDPEEPAGPAIYARAGTWWSRALDSRIHRCQWHRIELSLAALPPGSRVTISTLTSDEQISQADLANVAEERWMTRFSVLGELQPESLQPAATERELLIQSRQGRYLWLRVELAADGYSSPRVDSLEISFPRRSLLDFLPALFSAEEESRWFVERLLAILQAEQDRSGATIDTIRRLFDPRAVPDEFVDYLASWLALPLEGAWSAEQKRRLLAAAPGYYPQRGTIAGLRAVLQTYLWNMTGIEPAEQGEIPAVAEGFRERQRLHLGAGASSLLGSAAPLWSRSFVGRLQLGVFSREGEVRLVSTGDPERDLFHEYAHRFRVFVPTGWVEDDEAEAMLRRAIDAEKPAHTQYDLCLVEPRLQVGVQSTAGLDSVIGTYAELHLACRDHASKRRMPSHRLALDSVLAEAPDADAGLVVGTESRVGIETHLS